MKSVRLRRSRRRAFGLAPVRAILAAGALPAAFLLIAVVGCARPETPLPRAFAPTPIDLAPRCLELPMAPPLDLVPAPDVAARLTGDARVLTLATPYAPLETAALGWPFARPASAFDTAFAAAVLAEGALTPDPEAFRRRRDALGGRHAVHVGESRIWLEVAFPSRNRDAALAWLVDARRLAPIDSIDGEALAPLERRARIASLAAAAAPEALADRALARLARPARAEASTPAAPRSPAAWREWLEATLASPDVALIHTIASPDASDPEAAAFRARARRVLGAETDGESALGAATSPESSAGAPEADEGARERSEEPAGGPIRPGTLHVVDRSGAPQVELRVGAPTVAPDHPDAPALEALASLLGRDVGGRLFRDLRERQGLAYRIDAFQTPDGDFVVSTRARPGNVAALVVGTEAHWRALVEEPLRDCEVEMLRARALGEAALERDDPTEARAALRRQLETLGRPRSSAERARRFAALDRDTLAAAARRHLDRAPFIVLVGDADALVPMLRAALPGRSIRVFDAALEPIR